MIDRPSHRRTAPDGEGRACRSRGNSQLSQHSRGRRRRIGPVLALGLAFAAPATAQQIAPASPTTYQRAIAAGYKAAMYCAGIFNAGRTEAQIDKVELLGIYPEYDAIVPTLTAKVDDDRSVEVTYDSSMPPRRAFWQIDRGCTLLPIGSEVVTITEDEFALNMATNPRRVGPVPADPRPWPMGDAGIAPRPSSAVVATIAKAFDRNTYGAGETIAALVVKDGRIVAEHYADGFGPFTSNRTWSVGKSMAGTLIGLAQLDPKAPAKIANWQSFDDPRSRITLDNLLRMASGLHSDTAGNRTDAIYFGGTAVDEQAPGWPLAVEPGTRFRYANNDILLAMMALRAQIGDAAYDGYAQRSLFVPLGMTHTVAEIDWRGNYILSSQVWSTARDFARLGQFWLDDGVWAGKRMLPEGWMTYMTTPSGPQAAAGPGYGATLWLFGPKHGLPEGSYAAQGNRGQYIMVIPSRKLVVVRRGEDPGPARFDIAKFAADVAAVVK